jgi:uncharacterized membrane protein YjgN (DUF898 family)
MTTPSIPEPQSWERISAEPPVVGDVPQPDAAIAAPRRAQTHQFAFDGGATTYFGTALLAFLITVCTLGICYPFGLVLRERWRAKHSYIEGRQLVFNGSAWGLFGLWWKWFFLMIITLGIYGFWVGPRISRWKWENTSWASYAPASMSVR